MVWYIMIHLVIPPATVESEVSSGLTPSTSAAHWSDFRKAGSLRDLVPSWYDTMSESLSLPLQSAASQVLKNLDLEACPESCFPGNLMLKWRIPQREVQCLAAVRRLMPLRKFSLWRGTTTAFTLHLSMQGSWKALICKKAGKNWNWKKNMSRVKSQSLPKTFGEKKQPTCPTTLGSINLPRTLFCEVIQLTLMPAIRIVPQQPSNKSHVIIWVDKVAVILLMLNHDMS